MELVTSTQKLFFLLLIAQLCAADEKQPSTKYFDQSGCQSCSCRDGRDGKDGRDGSHGKDGRDGISTAGTPGRDGRDGKDGEDCVECARGPIGPKGAPGEKGESGTRGPTGPEGKKGVPGPQGPHGIDGKPGTNGQRGQTGVKGAKGEQGSQGIKGICDAKLLQSIEDKITGLEQKMAKDDATRKTMQETINELQQKVTLLEKSAVKITNGKISKTVLPGKYATYTLEDIQWQSLHIAAAAACRGSTASGGGGPHANVVFARESSKTCQQVCARSYYKHCDGEVSIIGSIGKARSYPKAVGSFYNYGCGVNKSWGDELKAAADASITGSAGYISYCCCRH